MDIETYAILNKKIGGATQDISALEADIDNIQADLITKSKTIGTLQDDVDSFKNEIRYISTILTDVIDLLTYKYNAIADGSDVIVSVLGTGDRLSSATCEGVVSYINLAEEA